MIGGHGRSDASPNDFRFGNLKFQRNRIPPRKIIRHAKQHASAEKRLAPFSCAQGERDDSERRRIGAGLRVEAAILDFLEVITEALEDGVTLALRELALELVEGEMDDVVVVQLDTRQIVTQFEP